MKNEINNFKSTAEWKKLDNEFSQINMLFDVLHEAMLYNECTLPLSKYINILDIIEVHLKEIRTLI